MKLSDINPAAAYWAKASGKKIKDKIPIKKYLLK